MMNPTRLYGVLFAFLACACTNSDGKNDAALTADAGADRPGASDLEEPAGLGGDAASTDIRSTAIDAQRVVDAPAAIDAPAPIDVPAVIDVPAAEALAIDVGSSTPAELCRIFKTQEGVQLYLDNLQMLSPTLGYGVKAQNGGLFDIHRTTDGGRTWTKLTTVDSGNAGSTASWAMGFYPDDLWLSTYFSGFGINGTLLRSADGTTWQHMESGIRALWTNLAEPIGTIGKVLSTGELFVVARDGGKALAATTDRGTTWRRIDLSVQSARVAATQSYLFVRANTSSSSNDWSLFRLAADNLQELKSHLPADFWLTAWVPAAHDDVLTLVDDEATNTPTRRLLASSDGGATFATMLQQGPSGDVDGYLLRRGISVGTTAFASLSRASIRVRLVRSRDGGASWSTLLEESTSNDHYYWFHTDFQGNAYAVRHSSYSTAICSLVR